MFKINNVFFMYVEFIDTASGLFFFTIRITGAYRTTVNELEKVHLIWADAAWGYKLR